MINVSVMVNLVDSVLVFTECCNKICEKESSENYLKRFAGTKVVLKKLLLIYYYLENK